MLDEGNTDSGEKGIEGKSVILCGSMYVCICPIMELFLVEKSSGDIRYLQQEGGEDGIKEGVLRHMALGIDTQE